MKAATGNAPEAESSAPADKPGFETERLRIHAFIQGAESPFLHDLTAPAE